MIMSGKTVLILGGGIGGMVVASELRRQNVGNIDPYLISFHTFFIKSLHWRGKM